MLTTHKHFENTTFFSIFTLISPNGLFILNQISRMEGFITIRMSEVAYTFKLKKISFVSACTSDEGDHILQVICDGQAVKMFAFDKIEVMKARNRILNELEEYENIKALM